jgi:hypothetical protein
MCAIAPAHVRDCLQEFRQLQVHRTSLARLDLIDHGRIKDLFESCSKPILILEHAPPPVARAARHTASPCGSFAIWGVGDPHDYDFLIRELISGVSQRFAAHAAGNNNTPQIGETTNKYASRKYAT